jgi:hypothetical protein
MFSDMWKQIPWQFKTVWIFSAVLSLSATGLIIWAIVRLVLKYT